MGPTSASFDPGGVCEYFFAYEKNLVIKLSPRAKKFFFMKLHATFINHANYF